MVRCVMWEDIKGAPHYSLPIHLMIPPGRSTTLTVMLQCNVCEQQHVQKNHFRVVMADQLCVKLLPKSSRERP